MPQKLLSLYIRAGVGAARLAIKTTARVVDAAASAAGFGRPAAGQPARTAPRSDEQPTPSPAVVEPDRPAPPAEPREPEIDYDAEPPTPLGREQERAKTIDDEPELVEELAEPGAEDGAGAELEVEEPWEGYHELHADEIIARVEHASAAELGVIELYERAHRNRQMVLGAAERRLKTLSGPASR